MANDPVPEADAQEQATPLLPNDPGDVERIPADASEADAMDQARPARPGVVDLDPGRLRLAADVPEADALDQARPVPFGDDEDEDL